MVDRFSVEHAGGGRGGMVAGFRRGNSNRSTSDKDHIKCAGEKTTTQGLAVI
jgi:hypothetical protein